METRWMKTRWRKLQRRFRSTSVAKLTVAGGVVVAAAVAVALVVYLGSRDDPAEPEQPWDDTVAAYVGEVAITEEEVDAVIAELRQAREPAAREVPEDQAEGLDEAAQAAIVDDQLAELDARMALDRDRVIQMRILTEAGTRHADQTGLTIPPPEVDHLAEDIGLEPENAYVVVAAEFFAVMNALQETVVPVEPTEEDQREVHDHLVADGLTSTTFEQAKPQLTRDAIGDPVALRNLLVEVVDQAGIRVNPRHDPVYRVAVPIGEGATWLAVPLGGSGGSGG
jgi:hypothetical protein